VSELIINNELCKQIQKFERYHISESGRIYRTHPRKNNGKEKDLMKFRSYISENKLHFRIVNGELRQGLVSITDNNGRLHNLVVSNLITVAFIDEKYNKKLKSIEYKDGNKKNLHYTNLYITEKKHNQSKLTRSDVVEIKKLIKQAVPLRQIGKKFGVSEMQINRIKTGENWGNGKRKIKAPVAPFEIKDGKMRKYIAIFERKKVKSNVRKKFTVKRNSQKPTDNTIVGIVNGYKLSLKHTNITRALQLVDKLNDYFFPINKEKSKFKIIRKAPIRKV